MKKEVLILLFIGIGLPSSALGIDWRGDVEYELRTFPDNSQPKRFNTNSSIGAQFELYESWNSDSDTFTFVPHMRVDQHDNERTKFDIRELLWTHVQSHWEARVGVGKVFWGVTEGRHLVDIVNQTDFVDQYDGDEKLGQPMLAFSRITLFGTFDVYVLPFFRERTFSGSSGRPGLPIDVETDNAEYESSAEQWRTDVAFRWQIELDDWQLGFSHFSGTSRAPELILNISESAINHLLTTGSFASYDKPSFTPLYRVIDQTGIEILNVYESFLFKLEAITSSGLGKRYQASALGGEFTQYSVFDSDIDVGWILEYFYDSRTGKDSVAFDDDWLMGARFVFNDVDNSEILVGVIIDPSTKEKVINFESKTRFGNEILFSLDARYFVDAGKVPSPESFVMSALQGQRLNKPLSLVESESVIQVTIKYFF